MKKTIALISLTIIMALIMSGCGLLETIIDQKSENGIKAISASAEIDATPVPTVGPVSIGALEAIQAGFRGVYAQVMPSVVNIQVVKTVNQGLLPDGGEFPFPFPFQLPEEGREFRQSGLGSGFIWDKEGHIVTNNHVVEGAEEITLTFYDGTSVDAEIIGTDRDSDLAVLKVDHSEELLHPVKVADSTQVEVGQLVAAIGNPFGLQGTMTIGVVSALGRSLPVGSSSLQGSSYTIPDVIQTDAPINPGNSGGVLVDMYTKLVGVPTAIESSSGVNAGIGFVVPSVIVSKVVPVLIDQGYYEHPWIGISGTTLNSDFAEKMGLLRDQRGALVIDVVPNSPADEAGLVGSDGLVTIDQQEVRLGGDIIIKVDSQSVKDFEDLTAYLARHTEAGKTVKLTVLREGKQEILELTLGVRPSSQPAEIRAEESKPGDAWLGISGLSMSPEIANAMDLSINQKGALIQQVIENGPADHAGLRGSYKTITINGEQVLIGGDIIVALEDENIDDLNDLHTALAKYKPDDEVTLTILRDGDSQKVEVTLGAQA